MRVEPIRDNDQIRRIVERLKEDDSRAGCRRYLLFMSGIYLGRRISDLLPLRVGEVLGKDRIDVVEQKTGKRITLFIATPLKKAYKQVLTGRDPDEYVFQSDRVDRITRKPRPISRRTAYDDMKVIAKIGGFPEDYRIGTHTLRKTFGYRYYQSTRDIAGLMQLFNHTREDVTLIYIGIKTDEVKKTFRKVDSMYDT